MRDCLLKGLVLSIIGAAIMWAVIFCTGCTAVSDLPGPDVGHVWECNGHFSCNGTIYSVTPIHGCARSEPDAEDHAMERIETLGAQANCGDDLDVTVRCLAQDDYCEVQ